MPRKNESETPEIWTLDCETDPFNGTRIPKPFLWGIYTGKEYFEFDSVDDVAGFLEDKDVICYGHNAGKFDFHFMLEHANVHEPVTVINGRLTEFKIGKCRLRDSFCILPVALEKYKKQKIDYAIFEPGERDKPHNRKAIAEYLRLDCVYLYEFVSQFISLYGLHLTQAGASMRTWEAMSEREAPRTFSDYYDRYAPYYYGGRVQCFRQGIIDTTFQVADINSAYPFAMREPHPIGTHPFQRHRQLRHQIKALGPCMMTVRGKSGGGLPFRSPDHKFKIFYPKENSMRNYFVTGWEYLGALETRTLRDAEVLEIHEPDEVTDFRDYIDHFYAQRRAARERGDTAMAEFGKLFMNGLYGKFAADPREYGEFQFCLSADDALQRGYTPAGRFGGHLLGHKELPPARQRFYNLLTSASITGYVRAYLWKAIARSSGVLYCDTDSIAAERIPVEYGPELGQWKDEGTFDRAAIAGKKMYAFRPADGSKWKTASKGVRLTSQEIVEVAKGAPQTWRAYAPTFSLSNKNGPQHAARRVTRNAEDISRVPVASGAPPVHR